jgi:hypothetical protein
MSYLIHEHSNYTSSIDKYWHFFEKQNALVFYYQMIENWKSQINYEVYEEIYEDDFERLCEDSDKFKKFILDKLLNDTHDNTVLLLKKNYLVFITLNNKGEGRRL